MRGINIFYEKRPTTNKTWLDIIGNGPTVQFRTYNETININLDTKKIEGLPSSSFPTYTELFKAANLTNYIKYICRSKESKNPKPFYLSSLPTKDLMFNDVQIFSSLFDTEIINFKTLKDISPTLFTFKKEYCDYLNGIQPPFWKLKQ